MATSGILEWTNEHSRSGYPLSRLTTLPADLIVDASFVQFDGFVPVLKAVAVGTTEAVFTLTLDLGELKVSVAPPVTNYTPGYAQALYLSGRYVGTLVFGNGLPELFQTFQNTTHKLNTPFLSSVVRGVSRKLGVFSFGGYVGEVSVNTGSTSAQQVLFFDVTGNQVTWNAGWLGTKVDKVPLKTLNGVAPLNQALYLEDSELLKFTPIGNNLNISVLGVGAASSALSSVKKFE